MAIGNIPNKIVNPKTGDLTPEAKRWFYEFFNEIGGISGFTFAPYTASYILNTLNTELPDSQALSLLDSGFAKVTSGSGLITSTGRDKITGEDLEVVGVSPGAYGSESQIPQFEIDSHGRVVQATSLPIETIYDELGQPIVKFENSSSVGNYLYPTFYNSSYVPYMSLPQGCPGFGFDLDLGGGGVFPARVDIGRFDGSSYGAGILMTPGGEISDGYNGLPTFLQAGYTSTNDLKFTLPNDFPAGNNYAIVSSTAGIWSFLQVPTGSGTSSGTNTGDQNVFGQITVSGQTDVDATGDDSVEFIAGSNMTITTSGNTITFASSGGAGYTDEEAQDAVGTILTDSSSIDFTYTDATPEITAVIKAGGVTNAMLAGSIDLTTKVTGDLPLSNLAQGSALSVLGVTGNSTADNASIAAASDHQVMRRSGTAVAFGAVNLAQSAAVTGTLPIANGGTGVSAIVSCSAYASSGTNINAGATTKIVLATENFDIGGIFDNATNYRCTPTKAGIYLASWQVGISDADVVTTAQNNSILRKNGASYRFGSYNANLTGLVVSMGSSLVSMNGTTDYLELFFLNGQGAGTLSTNNDNLVTYLDVVWVGPNA